MADQVKSSKHVGVYWSKSDKRWRAKARLRGKIIHLGNYLDEDIAGKVYQNFLKIKNTL